MKTWEEIDVNEKIAFEEFYTLFSKVPLTQEEKDGLYEYYQMYEKFIEADVKPADAWVAVRNVFVIKNPQIADRTKHDKEMDENSNDIGDFGPGINY